MINKRYQVLLLTCIAFCFLITGCAAPRYARHEFVNAPDVQVMLTKEIIDGKVEKRDFDHPWYIDEETLDAVLSSITFHYISILGEKKPVAAFPAKLRARLVPYLVDAFSKATPDEMVYFAYLGSETFLYIAGKNYFTNGVMFVKNNRLNVAFRYLYLDGPDSFHDMPGAWRLDPRQKPQATGWILNEGQGMELVRPSDTSGLFAMKQYNNWIRIDLHEDWIARRPRRRHMKKARHSTKKEGYGYKPAPPVPPEKADSDDTEGIIIRPPKGYFSIKKYPEMKPKE